MYYSQKRPLWVYWPRLIKNSAKLDVDCSIDIIWVMGQKVSFTVIVVEKKHKDQFLVWFFCYLQNNYTIFPFLVHYLSACFFFLKSRILFTCQVKENQWSPSVVFCESPIKSPFHSRIIKQWHYFLTGVNGVEPLLLLVEAEHFRLI